MRINFICYKIVTTIFKSVGSAVLDVVVAAKIVAQAQTKNLGVQL
ncbi:hypothetical protein [Gallibacterium anatis]|nr:hypothetical protein [Gallibacterium anatis]